MLACELFRNCLGFHYAKPKRRTRKRGTEQLARTRDTTRAKQSCTENFRRAPRTELITVATRLCRRATPSKSLPRPTPCRLAGCALCVNAPGVSLLGLHVASGCSLFSHASAIRLTSLGPPLLLAWRRSRRPVVTVTMSIGPVVATATASPVAIVSTAAASAADAAVVFDVPAAALPTEGVEPQTSCVTIVSLALYQLGCLGLQFL